MYSRSFEMKMLNNFSSVFSKIAFRFKNSDTRSLANRDIGQSFVVIAYRDQDLYVYMIRISPKGFSVLNFIELKLPSLVVGQDHVLRSNELTEIISDVLEVFAHENGETLHLDQLPVILFLEPSKFSISTFSLPEESSFSEIKIQLENQEIYEIFSQSPFIQEDTCVEPFSVSSNIEDLKDINVMFASKKLLKSWSDAIQAIGLKIAYIGPSTTPLFLDLAESNEHPCLLLDMQRLNSKVYCIDGQNEPILDFKFPYGYIQFLSKDNILDLGSIKKRLEATISHQDHLSNFQNAKVLISGVSNSPSFLDNKSNIIDKLSFSSVNLDEKQIRFKSQVNENLPPTARELLITTFSLCSRLMQ